MRHQVGLREMQRAHRQPPEGQSRARGGPRAPHSGHTSRPRALPRQMRPHTPRSISAPLRIAMRARDEHAFNAVGSTVPTESTRDNRVHHYTERPTHEDHQGNSGNAQRSTNNSGMNNSGSRPSLRPKVQIFDGTVSAQFRPWIIQFEAIARHQCWTLGERVVRLVSSQTGPAANMLIGMSMGQLDDYAFLVARLSRRYDPPEREEAHRAELRVRTRRRNETAEEFAENLKNLAQRAYTNADQNMLDNLVVERFREGHGNEALKKHLCLYPSTGLQDLIGACVRFETHVENGASAHKSNEGLYTVQGNNSSDLSLREKLASRCAHG